MSLAVTRTTPRPPAADGRGAVSQRRDQHGRSAQIAFYGPRRIRSAISRWCRSGLSSENAATQEKSQREGKTMAAGTVANFQRAKGIWFIARDDGGEEFSRTSQTATKSIEALMQGAARPL